jgi:hypothetical protein
MASALLPDQERRANKPSKAAQLLANLSDTRYFRSLWTANLSRSVPLATMPCFKLLCILTIRFLAYGYVYARVSVEGMASALLPDQERRANKSLQRSEVRSLLANLSDTRYFRSLWTANLSRSVPVEGMASALLPDQERRANKPSKAAQQLKAWHRRQRHRAGEVCRP